MLKIGDIDLESGPAYTLTQSPDLDLDFPALDGSNAKRPVRAPRTIPDREPTNRDNARYTAAVLVVAAILAALMGAFLIGRATLTDDLASAADDTAAAENLAAAYRAERDSIEASLTALSERVDGIESDLTSATAAAEMWQQRAEDASATAAAVAADNEALKRDIARIQQMKATIPAKGATTTVTSTGWQTAKVSWYGPGFYGNTMAGGGVLTTSSMVVAHRTMAFGTRIEFSYNGRTCVAEVRDRGPFIAGRTFDLGPGTAKALGFSGVGTVQWRVV